MGIFASKDSRIGALGEVPLFSGLHKKELGEIAQHVDDATLPDGTKLTTQGEMAHQVIVIVAGTVREERDGKHINTLGPGDTLGVMSTIDGEPQSSTCIADGDCTALVMSLTDLRTLFDAVPALTRRVMVTLSRRLRETEVKLADCLNADPG